MISTFVEMVFEHADTDKNGDISVEEYVRWSEDWEQQVELSRAVEEMVIPYVAEVAEEVQGQFMLALRETMLR